MAVMTISDTGRVAIVFGRQFPWPTMADKAGAILHAENYRQSVLRQRETRLNGRELTFDERQAGAALQGRHDDMTRLDRVQAAMFAPVLIERLAPPPRHPFDEFRDSPAWNQLHPETKPLTPDQWHEKAKRAYDAEQAALNAPQVPDDPHRAKVLETAYMVFEAVAYDVRFPHSTLEAARNLLKQAEAQDSDVGHTRAMARELTAKIRGIEADREREFRRQHEATKLSVPDLDLEIARTEMEDAQAEADTFKRELAEIRAKYGFADDPDPVREQLGQQIANDMKNGLYSEEA